MYRKIFLLVALVVVVRSRPEFKANDDKSMHARQKRAIDKHAAFNEEENTAEFWRQNAQLTLNSKLQTVPNTNVAKNVIMFLGDGMSITTLAGARTYKGQQQGTTGEETYLSFEEFPYTGLSKTYCVDAQVADSACSATAYLCGVKANSGTIGVTGQVPLGRCDVSLDESTHVSSIARWSQLKNKRTGIVTTTRVTHASPTGTYGHTADRDWESDFDLKQLNGSAECKDIAYQLVHGVTGSEFNVILGGGREKFLPSDVQDEEGDFGERLDGENLINTWQELKKDRNAKYVWNRDDLLNVPPETDYLLGLFEASHCRYNLDRTAADPSLAEMVEAAIKVLSKSETGYFLFVEGGRIDHAHHDTKAHKALDETVQLSEAVRRATELVNGEDTLIVVTSDHAHTVSMSGYADRGHDIFGIAGTADDALPYSTITYANGPGYKPNVDGKRYDISNDDMQNKNYEFPTLAPLDSETHGGEDVGIFARGPWAHLFRGVIEENVIPHIMAYASCVGDGITVCDTLQNKRRN